MSAIDESHARGAERLFGRKAQANSAVTRVHGHQLEAVALGGASEGSQRIIWL